MSDLNRGPYSYRGSGTRHIGAAGDARCCLFADEIFGFHVQQAAEKLLKAWLAILGEVYPLTHDLDLLLDLLQKRASGTARFRNLVEFVPYAVQFRYDVDSDPEALDRASALQRVEDLLKHVRQRLTEAEGG